jgi:AbrB family looped-hinge helix DNA binding protein
MDVRSKAKVTSKGQVTIPLAVRRQLGVEAGDTIAFELTTDGIRMTVDREPGVFAKWTGRWRSGRGQTAAEIDRWLRTVRGHDDE